MIYNPSAIKKDGAAISVWILCCAALVVGMVALGGYTRLSGSGLSITYWKPLHGILPPLSAEDWNAEFLNYLATPQYKLINAGMTLDEFKAIFWPEYLHRMLGRTVGIVFFVPFILFGLRKSLTQSFAVKLAAIFALGGLQGLAGWLMVKSGLIDNPYVHHVRLAIHFSLALLIFSCLQLCWMHLTQHNTAKIQNKTTSKHVTAILALLALQLVYGAFMAGLHAGHVYNTWPDFNGAILPSDLTTDNGISSDMLNHIPFVQLIHRTLAIALWLYVMIWGIKQLNYDGNNKLYLHLIKLLLTIINLQFILGVTTLIYVVPLSLAWMHQLVAVILLSTIIAIRYYVQPAKTGATRDDD